MRDDVVIELLSHTLPLLVEYIVGHLQQLFFKLLLFLHFAEAGGRFVFVAIICRSLLLKLQGLQWSQ